MVQNRTAGARAFNAFNILVMCFLLLTSIYPVYYATINSMNTGSAILLGYSALWPREFTMDSWRTVISDPSILRAFNITASRTFLVTFIAIFNTSMFAYAFSRPYLKGKRFYTVLGFVSMYFSGGIIPFFLLLNWLNLYNTYWVYIVPFMFGGFFNVIIFNANFKALPDSLFESAKLDGAGEFRIYTQIVLPLSKPVLAALSVFMAVGVWNDFTVTLFYTHDPALQTLQYFILRLVRSHNAAEQLAASVMAGDAAIAATINRHLLGTGTVNAKTLELAAMVMASIPMIILYPFAQKYFVKGIMLGSVKG